MSRTFKLLGAAAIAVTAVGLAPQSGFASQPPAPPSTPALNPAAGLPPGMAAAMRRDLKLDNGEIADRLRTEAAAPAVEKRLRARLGKTYAGAWIPVGSERLTVAVTDPAAVADVRAEGADAKVVDRGTDQLQRAKTALDRHRGKAGKAVHSWYVDDASNSVVVSVKRGSEAAAKAFVKASGLAGGTVKVVSSPGTPRTVYDLRGGDQYVINGNILCSVGFSVAGGFVTAGHCGATGSPTRGHNGVAQGTFAGSSFPDNDYAWVRTNGDWTPRPWVNNYSGGQVTVAGSRDAAIGSSICRSGRTTQWRCGTLQARNETVNYPQGAVHGLSRMTACAEGGDSGGSVISGDQAQGVTSGTNGNCTSGGSTWFQPVNEILSTYGLSLTTSGGGGSSSRLVSNYNNKCLDVPGGNFADGQRLEMFDCHGGANQSWEFVNGTLRTQNNKCVDVAGGSTANGARVQLHTCNNTGAQQFVLSAAGDLVNPQANKCVDIDAWNPDNGARLILWECHGGANQKWRRG